MDRVRHRYTTWRGWEASVERERELDLAPTPSSVREPDCCGVVLLQKSEVAAFLNVGWKMISYPARSQATLELRDVNG